jgi:hypothetical protein
MADFLNRRNPATGGPAGVPPQALPVNPWSKRYGYCCGQLDGAQVLSGGLARPTVCDNVKRHLLPFVEAAHACAFNRADMNEDIFVTVLWLNEAEALLAIKPLMGGLPYMWMNEAALMRPVGSRFRREGR